VLGGCCENRLAVGFIWLGERRKHGSEPLASINGELGNCYYPSGTIFMDFTGLLAVEPGRPAAKPDTALSACT
jgi:hypothetical protein